METSELVQAINALEGTDYDYVSPLPGGHQRGAHLIADSKGTKAVLKCSAHKAYLRQLDRVSPILNAARIRGYPAPRYLRWGEVSDQVYLVYEYISGESLPGITSKTLPLILDLVDLQADLHLRTEQDWSKYAYDVVFNNESGWSEILRNQTEMTRQFMDEVDRTCKEFTGYFLPTDDLVHGDLGGRTSCGMVTRSRA